jgi:hypothetical protein
MKKTSAIAAALVLAALVGGCSDEGVTLYEAGVYKGHSDPLLQGQGAERTETLQKRLRTSQVDR